MECVEKKMWMNLHFQGFQLRLHELRAQFGSLQLAFAETVVVTERVAHSEYDPVNEHPLIEVEKSEIEEPERGNTARPSYESPVQDEMRHEQRAAQKDACAEVKSRSSFPIVTFETITPGEPEDEWRGERP